MFVYYAVGLVWWVDGVHYGDMEAMKAEGQVSLEPPRNPGYASTGYCMPALGLVESGVVGNYEYAASTGLRGVSVVVVSTVAGLREQRGVRPCFAACVLLCTLLAALRP